MILQGKAQREALSHQNNRLDGLKDYHQNAGPLNKRARDEDIILKSDSTTSDLFGQVRYAPHNNSSRGLQKIIDHPHEFYAILIKLVHSFQR